MDFNPDHYDEIIVFGLFVFFGILEAIGGLYGSNSKRTKKDWIIEFLSFGQLLIFIKPAIVFFTVYLLSTILPVYSDSYVHWNMWLGLPFVLLIDDVLQYWYHRKAHEWEWLWKLHRPHHAAPEMGVLVTYRNAVLYYLLMPNLWWLGFAMYLGLAQSVALLLIFKQLVVIGAHSDFRWDQYLYKYKLLHPFAWLVERTISTPATHFAHHGKTARDGISSPNGNFGNMLFIWDMMFGTAMITRQYPTEYGLQNDPDDSWQSHLYYPFVKSDKKGSELSKDYKKEQNTTLSACKMELEAGKYLWCGCGYSQNQPFCDGSHHGTQYKPVLFEVKRKRTVSLCNCKLTKRAPFCDDSHLEVELIEDLKVQETIKE